MRRRVEGGGEACQRGDRPVQPHAVAVDHGEGAGAETGQGAGDAAAGLQQLVLALEDGCAAAARPATAAATWSACQCAFTTACRTPAASSRSSAWSSRLRPCRGSSGFAVFSVSGRIRRPRPAASTMPWVRAVTRRLPRRRVRAAGCAASRAGHARRGSRAAARRPAAPGRGRAAPSSAGRGGGSRGLPSRRSSRTQSAATRRCRCAACAAMAARNSPRSSPGRSAR